MRAWMLQSPGGELTLDDIAKPVARPGGVVVGMEATPLLSYLGAYVRGELPGYVPADTTFSPGTNGVGVVDAVGDGVYHLKPGDRVALNPFLTANEAVADPARALIGLTRITPDSAALMTDWPDGTLREFAHFPAACAVPLPGLDTLPSARLATLGKFIVPFGGLRRGRLFAGETLVVHGATGYFGSAAVLLGLALGASRVVAAGRNVDALAALAKLGESRITTVALSGEVEADAKALRTAADGGADMVFDIVGRARSTDGTLAALRSLRRGGRMVVMGSLEVPFTLDYNELMLNDWSVHGQFMYDGDAYPALIKLVRAGLLDLDAVNVTTFECAALEEAIQAAARMSGLDCTVVTFST